MTQFVDIKMTTEADTDINLKDDYQLSLLISAFNSSSLFFTIKSSSLKEKKVVFNSFTTFIKMFSNESYTSQKNHKYFNNLKTVTACYSKINQSSERRIISHININDRKMQSQKKTKLKKTLK